MNVKQACWTRHPSPHIFTFVQSITLWLHQDSLYSTLQTVRPEFNPQNISKKYQIWWHTHNPSDDGVETGGFQEHSG